MSEERGRGRSAGSGRLACCHHVPGNWRSFDAQANEVLAILVTYNIRVLAREVWMGDLQLDLQSEVLAFRDCIAEVVEMRKSESKVQAA